MEVEVSTQVYEFDHGRRPSGRGHWAFYFGNKTTIEDAYFVPGFRLYHEAKQEAIKEARRRGESLIIVAP